MYIVPKNKVYMLSNVHLSAQQACNWRPLSLGCSAMLFVIPFTPELSEKVTVCKNNNFFSIRRGEKGRIECVLLLGP